MSGYLEVQPFGKTWARHAFLFFTPTFSFGNNVPQFKYTASMAGIAFERAVGFGFELPKNFEFRVAECGLFLRDAHLDQRLLLALVHEREGRARETRLELERLLDPDPENALANHMLGNLYFHQGALDLAIEHYGKALETAPHFVNAYYDLGVAHFHRGNMPEAIRAFRRCLEIEPGYNAAHYRLAICLFHAGELEGAKEHHQLSSALTPEYLMARYHIGVIHERAGDFAAAAREFRRSMEEGVGEVSSIYHLAQIRRAEGDTAGAEELLKKAREFAAKVKATINSRSAS